MSQVVIRLGLTTDGEIVFFDEKGEQIEQTELEKLHRIPMGDLEKRIREGNLLHYKDISIFLTQKSPLKVYVKIGGTLYCFQIDETNWTIRPCSF